MAVMTDPQRAALVAELMAEISAARELCPVTKTALRAALDAADAWCSDNAASYNSALPVGFRTNASVAQKSRLLESVIKRRRALGV
jgi:hypothetical protein